MNELLQWKHEYDFSESSGNHSESTPCRLCMKKYDYYYHIFTSIVSSEITVEDALYDLVELKGAVGDGLPGYLCALCLVKLIEFNDFRNICHKSDAELRNFSCINYLRGFQLVKGSLEKHLSGDYSFLSLTDSFNLRMEHLKQGNEGM
ncbi:uncharacterized protein LOC124173137 isoform X2 [Ischnura elegans]|uniref:uncharacterized protein LOC124173137 isoform X2 n=1 Tax=Ischnura elegans TaxID=197161 RepID=UPI001ED8BF0E|nr:uncharacterized protein LOC124173137 isoform X2 [Ischnura elegans]